MGMKTNSSGDSAVSLPQSMKKAKFVKRFDMKVTSLQSYGLLRRDTPSPTQTSHKANNESIIIDDGKKTPKGRIVHLNEHPSKAALVPSNHHQKTLHLNEYPIDPNNVVASIHRNLQLMQEADNIDDVKTVTESRDDENASENNVSNGGRDDEEIDGRSVDNAESNNFVLDDDCDSVDSLWHDCIQATCKMSVDDIYDEDELLGLAFVRD